MTEIRPTLTILRIPNKTVSFLMAEVLVKTYNTSIKKGISSSIIVDELLKIVESDSMTLGELLGDSCPADDRLLHINPYDMSVAWECFLEHVNPAVEFYSTAELRLA